MTCNRIRGSELSHNFTLVSRSNWGLKMYCDFNTHVFGVDKMIRRPDVKLIRVCSSVLITTEM